MYVYVKSVSNNVSFFHLISIEGRRSTKQRKKVCYTELIREGAALRSKKTRLKLFIRLSFFFFSLVKPFFRLFQIVKIQVGRVDKHAKRAKSLAGDMPTRSSQAEVELKSHFSNMLLLCSVHFLFFPFILFLFDFWIKKKKGAELCVQIQPNSKENVATRSSLSLVSLLCLPNLVLSLIHVRCLQHVETKQREKEQHSAEKTDVRRLAKQNKQTHKQQQQKKKYAKTFLLETLRTF